MPGYHPTPTVPTYVVPNPCGAVHGAFHDDGEPIVCTSAAHGTDADHADHSHVEQYGDVVTWADVADADQDAPMQLLPLLGWSPR